MNILQHLHDHIVPNARNSYKPLALRHRPLSLYVGLLLSVKILSMVSVGLIPVTSEASALSAANILNLTNASRTGYKLASLKENAFLDAAAQAKANDMVTKGYFAHLSPEGSTPWDFIKAQGYNYTIAGENLAINYYSAEGVQQAWMNSPGHKANILNKDFKEVGIGIAQGQYKGNTAVFVVQMFGSPSDQRMVWKNTYTKPQKNLKKLSLPDSKVIALSEPVLAAEEYKLQNQSEYQLSGIAKSADEVYVLVNDQAVATLPVIDNQFKGTVDLPEGLNTIQVVGYYNNLVASPLSEKINVQVDSSAPTISNPEFNGNVITVDVQGSAVKVIATAGEQNIMLQPTSNPNVWTGTFDSSNFKGKILVRAVDLAGNKSISDSGTITSSISDTYGFAAPLKQQAHNPLYLYFSLGLMLALGTAIGVKKEIQHPGLIAHTSAVAAFALLLWVT